MTVSRYSRAPFSYASVSACIAVRAATCSGVGAGGGGDQLPCDRGAAAPDGVTVGGASPEAVAASLDPPSGDAPASAETTAAPAATVAVGARAPASIPTDTVAGEHGRAARDLGALRAHRPT